MAYGFFGQLFWMFVGISLLVFLGRAMSSEGKMPVKTLAVLMILGILGTAGSLILL